MDKIILLFLLIFVVLVFILSYKNEKLKQIKEEMKSLINANNNSILVFEQNGIKQDGAKLVVRPIENILGILRFKEDVK